MSDELLVRHGAPTLAGLKTASLFPCTCRSRSALLDTVRSMNQRLRSKGLRVLPLRFTGDRALIYVYRPRKLREDLSAPTACSILRRMGYETTDFRQCLGRLARRIREGEEFPHEIGLFLGYPPEDVEGFLEDRECKCTGCWKVYGDEAGAKRKFAQYKKCTSVYRRCWESGGSLERLAVAR